MAQIRAESAELFQPSLEDLAPVLREGLAQNFKNVEVKIVDCPNLKAAPFNLASEGLSGKASIADIGGVPFLLPIARTDRPQYSFQNVFSETGIASQGLIIGAGAGPHFDMGTNCEMMANIAMKDGLVTRNLTKGCVVKGDSYELVNTDSTNFALLGNFYCSEGKPGKVLEVVVSERVGEKDFSCCIKQSLAENYGERAVGLGGAFLIERGKAKCHVMPKFSETPLNTEKELNGWLRFFNMKAPLVCVGELISHDPGLDLRLEHFHCYSGHGDGGHYHYDVTPREVVYRGYFNVAEKVYRIDKPAS